MILAMRSGCRPRCSDNRDKAIQHLGYFGIDPGRVVEWHQGVEIRLCHFIPESEVLIEVLEDRGQHLLGNLDVATPGINSKGSRGLSHRVERLFHRFFPFGAYGATDQILKAAAETCVEAANMIIDIVKMVIEFLISSLAVMVATAVLTFGASAAAWVAANIANGARALAQVMQGLAKVAQVLEKIAQVMEKVAQILRKIATILKEIQAILKEIKALKNGATLGERLVLSGANSVVSFPINQTSNLIINGASSVTGTDLPNMPGGVSEGYHAGQDVVGAVQSGNTENLAFMQRELDFPARRPYFEPTRLHRDFATQNLFGDGDRNRRRLASAGHQA